MTFGWRVGPESHDGCPYKKGDTEPHREEACEGRAEVEDAAQEPGAPRSWKRQEGHSPGAFGGSAALGHLISDFWPPELGANERLSSKPPGL